jgi:hypothetical protein
MAAENNDNARSEQVELMRELLKEFKELRELVTVQALTLPDRIAKAIADLADKDDE